MQSTFCSADNSFISFFLYILQINNENIQPGACALLPANIQSTFLFQTTDLLYFLFIIFNLNNKKIQHGASALLPANVQSTFLPRSRRLSLSQCFHSHGMVYFSIVWNGMKWNSKSPPFLLGQEDCLYLYKCLHVPKTTRHIMVLVSVSVWSWSWSISQFNLEGQNISSQVTEDEGLLEGEPLPVMVWIHGGAFRIGGYLYHISLFHKLYVHTSGV